MTLGITIIGCGAVAEGLYLHPLRRLERKGIVRVVSLVDANADRARALQRYFPRSVVGSDLSAALTRTPSDLALVLTPAHLHAPQALVALDHGNHLLCEKPMAMTDADCQIMTSAAKAAGKVLAIGMIRRFFPAFAQLKEVLQSGALGNLLSFEYREGRRFDWKVTTPAAFRPRAQGGTGVLFDIGPHVIDMLQWLFGPLKVDQYEDDALGGVESNARLEVRTAECPGIVQMSWDTPLANELRVYGMQKQAVLKLDHFDKLAVGRPSQFAEVPCNVTYAGDVEQPARRRLTPRTYGQAIYCQLIQTARAIILGEAPAACGRSGGQCIETLTQGLRLAKPLNATWLNLEQQGSIKKLHWSNRKCDPSPSSEQAASSAPAS